jgi:hypothetical protein
MIQVTAVVRRQDNDNFESVGNGHCEQFLVDINKLAKGGLLHLNSRKSNFASHEKQHIAVDT